MKVQKFNPTGDRGCGRRKKTWAEVIGMMIYLLVHACSKYLVNHNQTTTLLGWVCAVISCSNTRCFGKYINSRLTVLSTKSNRPFTMQSLVLKSVTLTAWLWRHRMYHIEKFYWLVTSNLSAWSTIGHDSVGFIVITASGHHVINKAWIIDNIILDNGIPYAFLGIGYRHDETNPVSHVLPEECTQV